jgi:hypothetical protein
MTGRMLVLPAALALAGVALIVAALLWGAP